jgi:hypothetical protein
MMQLFVFYILKAFSKEMAPDHLFFLIVTISRRFLFKGARRSNIGTIACQIHDTSDQMIKARLYAILCCPPTESTISLNVITWTGATWAKRCSQPNVA